MNTILTSSKLYNLGNSQVEYPILQFSAESVDPSAFAIPSRVRPGKQRKNPKKRTPDGKKTPSILALPRLEAISEEKADLRTPSRLLAIPIERKNRQQSEPRRHHEAEYQGERPIPEIEALGSLAGGHADVNQHAWACVPLGYEIGPVVREIRRGLLESH